MSGKIFAVIGAGFGDEGKGLAVDRLCSGGIFTVVRHNGGAQAGHTVDLPDGRRFIFHQLSSGSFRGADTFWAGTFLPDLFKLGGELSDFNAVSGFTPRIYADGSANATYADDVLINMASETVRGKGRHGSCGMGINEAVLRGEAGFRLEVGRIRGMSTEALYGELKLIRREYTPGRLRDLGLDMKNAGEYGELLQSDAVLYNYAEGMIRGAQLVSVVPDCKAFLSERDGIVFEGAQGLLLDSEYKKYAPHLTSSRTGLTNPAALCGKYGLSLDLAVYVMRSYVTRHGAGPLPYERDRIEIGNISADRTNQKNEWQGSLRYAVYESPEALAETILSDLSDKSGALFITHLNETDGFVRFASGDVAAADLADHPAFCGKIKKSYLSPTPFSDDVIKITL